MTVVQKYTGEIKNQEEAITILKETMKVVNTIKTKMKKKKSQTTRLETIGTDRIIRGAIEEVTDKIIISKEETSKMRILLNMINKMIYIKVGTRKTTINVVDTTTIIIKTIKNMIKDTPTTMTMVALS